MPASVVQIRIKSTAFNAGQPLEEFASYHQMVYRVYGSRVYTSPYVYAKPISISWNVGGHAKATTINTYKNLTLDVNGVEMTDVEFNALPVEGFRQYLAMDVDRGIVEVLKSGNAQTAAQILAGV